MALFRSEAQRMRAEPVILFSIGHQPCQRYTSWWLSTRKSAARAEQTVRDSSPSLTSASLPGTMVSGRSPLAGKLRATGRVPLMTWPLKDESGKAWGRAGIDEVGCFLLSSNSLPPPTPQLLPGSWPGSKIGIDETCDPPGAVSTADPWEHVKHWGAHHACPAYAWPAKQVIWVHRSFREEWAFRDPNDVAFFSPSNHQPDSSLTSPRPLTPAGSAD